MGPKYLHPADLYQTRWLIRFDRMWSIHCCDRVKMELMDEEKVGKPLGDPANKGEGRAQPDQAGAEGGMGFLGDQRQKDRTSDREQDRAKEPPLDGTVKKEHIQGDTDNKKPGAHLSTERKWEGRLSMEQRKREPLIIW